MHFTINREGIITKLHIERWDRKTLGQELVNKINSFRGKNYKKFILFALKNKLFLKIGILYLMGGETIVFWAKEGYMKILSGMGKEQDKPKYAKIYLRAVDASKFISVLHENHLMKEGCGSKIIEFDLGKKEIKDISFSFNISRNFINCIYSLTRHNSKDHEEDEESATVKEKLAFIAVGAESGVINILNKEKVENINPTELSNYSFIGCVELFNEQLEKEAERIMDRINKITEENKELFPRNKKKKHTSITDKIKDFFSY